MKIKNIILAAVALVAIALVPATILATTAHAADAAAVVSAPSTVSLSTVAAPSTVSPSTVVVATPWYQSIMTGQNIAWFFTLVSGIVAIFKNNALTTSQKSLRAVIVGVEQATQLP